MSDHDPGPTGYAIAGWLLVLAAIAWGFVAFAMDTAPEGTHNIGLLAQQELHLLSAGFALLFAVGLLLLDGQARARGAPDQARPAPAPEAPPVVDETRGGTKEADDSASTNRTGAFIIVGILVVLALSLILERGS